MSGLDRSPGAVVAAARAAEWAGRDGDGGNDEDDSDDDGTRTPTANVVVADPDATGVAERVDGGYEGPDAVACGHLAAALSVADSSDVRLHHGDVDLTSPGPWLVLAPLSGFVSTVATGTATATVTVSLDGTDRVRPVRDRLDAVLSAARARHEHYPVADDEQGVFRTGVTTFSFVDATASDTGLRVRFDVSTTPATTRGEIVERFASLVGEDDATGGPIEFEDGDVEVDVSFEVGVERAEPSDDLRGAVEAAHRAVVGDAEYEWLPRPTVLSRLPTAEKIAFGGGGFEDRIDGDDVARTRDLLRRVVERLADREAGDR
ncbi:hypothetical protein [Salinigranum sp. GCM10025319]|uniref:hypothetical protein n=1 Tax=Salinigranum sp. GCM10025319 TaxID=3252687 RepID=UPI003618A1E1